MIQKGTIVGLAIGLEEIEFLGIVVKHKMGLNIVREYDLGSGHITPNQYGFKDEDLIIHKVA